MLVKPWTNGVNKILCYRRCCKHGVNKCATNGVNKIKSCATDDVVNSGLMVLTRSYATDDVVNNELMVLTRSRDIEGTMV